MWTWGKAGEGVGSRGGRRFGGRPGHTLTCDHAPKHMSVGDFLVVSGKESASSARDVGVIPSHGAEIPQAVGQLNPCTARNSPSSTSEDAAQPNNKSLDKARHVCSDTLEGGPDAPKAPG